MSQHTKDDINPISHTFEVPLTRDYKADYKTLLEASYNGLQKCQCTHISEYQRGVRKNFLGRVQLEKK